ncbi:hypothetical protein WDW37_00480 [Bdellovibrionota bacterium FG-1]
MKRTLFFGLLLLSTHALAGSTEQLRVNNTFKTPDEVVAYYCARDASGFVWSGLLDAERKAFTFWKEAPNLDSFFIAKDYHLGPSEWIGHDKNHVSITVHYTMLAVGDAHGTRVPLQDRDQSVVFELKRVGGVWKIEKPEASTVAPIVLESQFRESINPSVYNP